jgi:hypothetical protein
LGPIFAFSEPEKYDLTNTKDFCENNDPLICQILGEKITPDL